MERNYQYNTACIANYTEAELQTSQNPFALICLAVQYNNLYRNDEEQRFNLKRNLIRILRQRAYKKEEIIELLEFISDTIHISDTMKNRIFDEEAMNITLSGFIPNSSLFLLCCSVVQMFF